MSEQTADMLARVLFKVYPCATAELEATRPLIDAALAYAEAYAGNGVSNREFGERERAFLGAARAYTIARAAGFA